MDREITKFKELNAYEIVKIPKGVKPITTRWVHTIKETFKGNDHKSRCVVRGFLQVTGRDFDPTRISSPVVDLTTIRILISIAVTKNYAIHQLDIESAYLNALLPEEHPLYVYPPKGYELQEDYCWKLKKAVYGAKQSGYEWYICLKDTIEKLEFTSSSVVEGLFYKRTKHDIIIVAIYVDDLIMVSSSDKLLKSFRNGLETHFNLKYLSKLGEYLGIKFEKTETGYTISQQQFITNLLKDFNIMGKYGKLIPMIKDKKRYTPPKLAEEDIDIPDSEYQDVGALLGAKERTLYQKGVGLLLWACRNTRPDISYATNKLGAKANKPSVNDLQKLIYCLRYLKDNMDLNLVYDRPEPEDEFTIVVYSDASFAPSEIDKRLITGNAIFLNGHLVSWATKRQKIITKSSASCELIALGVAIDETVNMKRMMKELGFPIKKVTIWEDNQAVIAKCYNQNTTHKSRYIDVTLKSIREILPTMEDVKGNKILRYIKSVKNIADFFTKPLGHTSFEPFRNYILGRGDERLKPIRELETSKT